MKFPGTTSREWLLRNHWDLGAHGGGKESLPKDSRPGFVSTVRPDLTQPTHGLKEEDTLGGILFLRLKTSHLRPKYESSTVTTMRCCERRLNRSARREASNISLRSRKGCQWLSICWVTLSCDLLRYTILSESSHLGQKGKERWKGKERRDFSKETLFPNITSI